MGYTKHHAITVTSWGEYIIKAHDKAVEIFGSTVSEIIDPKMNGYKSFFIAPDGSNEDWTESFEGNNKRNLFIEWINDQAEDEDNCIKYCEYFFGDDNGKSEVTNYN